MRETYIDIEYNMIALVIYGAAEVVYALTIVRSHYLRTRDSLLALLLSRGEDSLGSGK